MESHKIVDVITKDIRFPTSLEGHGSDPTHPDPDYSCAYVILKTNRSDLEGYGFTFTIGRGTNLVCMAIAEYKPLITGRNLDEIYGNFADFWRNLTQETQMRWLGPEKGITHLAVAAIINALWDLWGKIENKPVWKLLVDMTPEKLLSVVDFSYITDVINKDEALDLLKKKTEKRGERESFLLENGYPAYITSVGWSGYEDNKIRQLCRDALQDGWTRFKMKVGISIEDDRRRAKIIREEIGMDNLLMMDCNQKWDVSEAIDWMKRLAEFKPTWIEEPTSPDDVLGHAAIAEALNPLGIGVATGEHCQNRVIFKQFMQKKAFNYCQTDACRIGGINELIAVYLMAAKFGVPVCPHAGGVGLCELVQHLSFFDYIAVSGSLDKRMTEYADHLHEHMKYPVKVENGRYIAPQDPGYSSEFTPDTIRNYEYPNGQVWQQLFAEGKFKQH